MDKPTLEYFFTDAEHIETARENIEVMAKNDDSDADISGYMSSVEIFKEYKLEDERKQWGIQNFHQSIRRCMARLDRIGKSSSDWYKVRESYRPTAGKTGRELKQKHYMMSREGLVFLLFSLNGERATHFQVRFIETFFGMERLLKYISDNNGDMLAAIVRNMDSVDFEQVENLLHETNVIIEERELQSQSIPGWTESENTETPNKGPEPFNPGKKK